MRLVTVSGPAVEPVSTAEARLFLRVDHAAEDALIASLIVAARETVEAFAGRALVTRRVRETRDKWDARAGGSLRLALAPVAAMHSIKAVNADGSFATISGPVRIEDDRIWLAAPVAPALPLAGIEIEYDAGYGATAAHPPAALRQAVLLAVAGLYEHREGESSALAAARVLAAPHARVRL
jgi:uncharacterized phiE125 gp8 family phage protein